ncbi:MAG: TatD family hydrolase, partial [Muribaculaceae bacterium]|nr:TatD family hydrolase [Muribaculaceae bacterium]
WYSIGYHPWNTTAGRAAADEALSVIERLADDPRVVAIGEAGLDALRGADPSEQERVFLAQAEIAERHRLPLIIHCVRRYGRLMELHRSFRPSVPWVVHGFRGKAELARQLTAAGIGVSLPVPRPDLAHLPPHLIYHDSD